MNIGKLRRNWVKDEKLQAMKCADTNGFKAASIEFVDSVPSLYKWCDLNGSGGESALERSNTKELIQELSKLIRENKQLKEIIADKELELRKQADLLKKNEFSKEELKMIASEYINQSFPVKLVLDKLCLSRSSYYYKPAQEDHKAGRSKSDYTMTEDGLYLTEQ